MKSITASRFAAVGMAVFGFVALAREPVGAEESEPCSGFSWSLSDEVAAMQAQTTETVESKTELGSLPLTAVTLKLKPTAEFEFVVKPGAKKQALGANSWSGSFSVAQLGSPGLYQVSISREGWIDVIQNGDLLPSTAFTGKRECTVLCKSVRYEIGQGPVTIQISGVPEDTVKVTVREAK